MGTVEKQGQRVEGDGPWQEHLQGDLKHTVPLTSWILKDGWGMREPRAGKGPPTEGAVGSEGGRWESRVHFHDDK